MAYVQDIIFCENYEYGSDVGLTAKKIIANAVVNKLPSILPLSAIINYADLNFNEEYQNIIRLLDPEGNELVRAEGKVMGNSYIGMPKEHTVTSLVLRFERIKFDKPGTYAFQVFINGELSKVKELYVAVAPAVVESPNSNLGKVEVDATGSNLGN